jgi:parvulin-like peptidyl-prolyl isomerase
MLHGPRLLLLACLSALGGLPQEPRSEPVLRVGGEEIGAAEYGRWLIDTLGSRLARVFADDWVVYREADRRGVEVDERQVLEVLDWEIETRITHAFLGKKQGWLDELARTGRTEGGLRRQRFAELEPEVLTREIVAIDRVVPEYKIEREFELRHGRNGRRYDLSMIKFGVVQRTPPAGTPVEEARALRQATIEARRTDALAARERLLAGEDFGELAAELSDDSETGASRGRLPAVFSHWGWPDAFLDGLEALEIGELSPPLWGRGGWWLVLVHGVEITRLADVRAGIEAELVARGPEQDEIGRRRATLSEGLVVQVLPSMFSTEVHGDELPGEVVALSIDGQEVARKEYATWLLAVRGEASAHHFVEHWVVEREAARRGMAIDESEVRQRTQEYIERVILESHGGSREAWLAHIALSRGDEGTYFRDRMVRMRIELLTERLYLADRRVTPEMVRRRWEEVYGEGGRSIEARMILLRVGLPAPEPGLAREELQARIAAESARTRELAVDLVGRLRDGEDFATLARRHSQEPGSAARGGQLDGRFRPETWPEPVARAVQALAPGELSEPLDLGTAWVVFQVLSVMDVAFEDVSADLEQSLREARPSFAELAAYRNGLMQHLEIEVLPGMYSQ